MKIRTIFAVLLVVIIAMSSQCENDPVVVDDIRDNIEGKWACELDDGSGVPQDYQLEIIKDLDTDNKIYLQNFAYNGDTAVGTVTGNNITVAQQNVGSSSVFADGTISDNFQEITWTINIDGDDYTMVCTVGGITKNSFAK